MVSGNGNQDLVNGNRVGARVVSTNFDQPLGIPIKGNHHLKSSKEIFVVLNKKHSHIVSYTGEVYNHK